jgi:hypothetical protein
MVLMMSSGGLIKLHKKAAPELKVKNSIYFSSSKSISNNSLFGNTNNILQVIF